MNDEVVSEDIVSIYYEGVEAKMWVPNRDDHIQSTIRRTGKFYEQEMLDDAAVRVRGKVGVAVDVGANVGNHTIFLARHCGLEVHAFEPLIATASVLERSVELNQLGDRVTVHRFALGAERGDRTVDIVDAQNLGRTMLRRSKESAVSVEVRTLDEMTFDAPVVLLKVDVEGMELEVLRGALETLRRDQPFVYVEAQSPSSLLAVERLLFAAGYVVVDRFNSTPTYLFCPLTDDRSRMVSVNKRMAEIYRDMRSVNDAMAGLERRGAERSAELARALEREHVSREANAAGLARALETVSADLKAIQSSVRDSSAFDVAARQLQQRLSTLELRESSELTKLRYVNEQYKKKIDALMGSATYRYSSKLRSVTRSLGAKEASPTLTAADYFKKIEAKAEARTKRRTQQRPPSGPLIELPSAKREFTIDAHFPAVSSERDFSSKKTMAAMAVIPERAGTLQRVVDSLVGQVDRLCIYLNGFDGIPSWLAGYPSVETARSQDHGDMGDAGKFFWVDQHDGYYFSVDDDIVYCDDYVARLLARIDHYGHSAAVGWHGSLFKIPFEDYYSSQSRRVFSFDKHRPHDVYVHSLGTGCLAFHTSTITVRHADFREPNMADVFFAILAQQQRVPLVVVAHEEGELRVAEGTQESSINGESRNDVESVKNTRQRQTDLIQTVSTWRTYEWNRLNVLLIGRFEKFLKGGIHKSCKLIERELTARGNVVYTLDTHNPLDELPGPVDVAWIYPGDPDRPDYATVDEKIRFLRAANVPVLVNFSHIDIPERTTWIAAQLAKHNAGPGAKVFAALFTESPQDHPALAPFRDYLVMVPKTISTGTPARDIDFSGREGICFGDATKLGNPTIIGGDIAPWIDACRRRLPHVPLYAYKQYSGDVVDDRLTTVPHMADGFGEWLSQRRLFVCLNRHLTFEMVACEAQVVGTPVLYRHMPHSLSEYVGPTGVRIRTPEELAEVCALLYNDEGAWRQFSRMSSYHGKALDVGLHSASLEVSLRLAIVRSRSLAGAP